MEKAANLIQKAINGIVFILFVMVTIIMTVNVFGRFLQPYVPDGINVQITWADEFVKFAILWIVWLGSSVIILDKGHFSLHFLTRKYPDLKILKAIQFLSTIILAAVLIYYGVEVSIELSILKTPSLQISKMYVYMIVPLTGLLMIFFEFAALRKGNDRMRE